MMHFLPFCVLMLSFVVPSSRSGVAVLIEFLNLNSNETKKEKRKRLSPKFFKNHKLQGGCIEQAENESFIIYFLKTKIIFRFLIDKKKEQEIFFSPNPSPKRLK